MNEGNGLALDLSLLVLAVVGVGIFFAALRKILRFSAVAPPRRPRETGAREAHLPGSAPRDRDRTNHRARQAHPTYKPGKFRRLIWRVRHGAAKWPERLLGQPGGPLSW